MSRLKFGAVSLVVCLLLAGPACSRFKSYFPDKEKDYQFKTEIPPLELPDDLGRPSIEQAPALSPVATTPAEGAATDETERIHVERIIYDGGATRLRIDQSFSKSWRIVGKALARRSIEIIGRNKPSGLFIVMYDPSEQKVTDESLWDEVMFVFGQRSGKEQEYRIKLAEYEGFTEVIVLDENDKPLSSGPGLSLLQLLQETIEADLADKGQSPDDYE